MEKKTDTDVFITSGICGPTITYENQRGRVVVEWALPPDDYTRHLKVVPLVTDWDEYDAVCYELGKRIMDHFTGKRK